ncbi:ankyrin repeat and SOCS box protein 3-like isoform X2 [Watersipora subatra]
MLNDEVTDNLQTELHLDKLERLKMKKNIHHQVIFKEVKELVDASIGGNRDAINELDRMHITKLHKAAICNNYDEVQHILIHSTISINDKSWFGETALYFASYIGSLPLVMILLSYGAQVSTEDESEESELIAAVRTDQTSIVRVLASAGSNVNILCDEWTPLHVACFRKSAHVIRALVDLGANVNAMGEWTYCPINMIFVEHSKKVQLIHDCQDEWLIKRSLESLLISSDVDVNYSSHCALGNPQVITRALTLLSPSICRLLMNHGASTDVLFDYTKKAIHDELVVVFSIYGSKLGFGLADRIYRYTSCLELLICHGVEPASADMKTTARLLLRQLRLVPLSIKYPHLEPTFRMLLSFCTAGCGPVDLMSLCRRAVRRYLGHSIAHRLKSLDHVSPRLKSYILMEDIGESELYS